MVKVKFCGFTRKEDLKKALELGVDYVGFILYSKSPRHVAYDKLEELLPIAEGVKRVAVLVNPSYGEVKRALDLGFDLVQLHGEEDMDFAQKIGLDRVIKAFRVREGLHIDDKWKGAYAILLDAYKEGEYGGTGQSFNWDFAKHMVSRGFKVFLAGGLNSKNVSEAIKYVKPYCVDVSSGIEIGPGVKDHRKMEEFINEVKNASED